MTIASANQTGLGFTATTPAPPPSLVSDGFENGGWSTQQVTDKVGAWTLTFAGDSPPVEPHSGKMLADFNSGWIYKPAAETRLYQTTGFAIPKADTTATLTFWMYHDPFHDTANPPTWGVNVVQVQVSVAGKAWTNVGTAVPRYNGTTGWSPATVDLSAYAGKTIQIGFVGNSDHSGNDMYLDDVLVTGSK